MKLLHRLLGRKKPSQTPLRLRWTPELVERFWNGFAQTRLSELSFGRTGGKAFIVAIEHLLARDRTILDYGAGDGDIVALLLKKGYRVAAYEPAANRRALFTERFAEHEGYLGTIGLGDRGAYDVVLMVEVIEHILDDEFDSTLRRVASLVKPGGTVVVSTPYNEDLELSMAYCPVSNVLFNRWQHVRSFSGDSLSATMAKAGFTPIVVHYLDFHAQFFLPFETTESGGHQEVALPEHLRKIRANVSASVGNQSGLLYIGRKL